MDAMAPGLITDFPSEPFGCERFETAIPVSAAPAGYLDGITSTTVRKLLIDLRLAAEAIACSGQRPLVWVDDQTTAPGTAHVRLLEFKVPFVQLPAFDSKTSVLLIDCLNSPSSA
jgi:hypothetical protein